MAPTSPTGWKSVRLVLGLAGALIIGLALGMPDRRTAQHCVSAMPGKSLPEPTPTATPLTSKIAALAGIRPSQLFILGSARRDMASALWPTVALSTAHTVYRIEEPVVITFTVANHNPFTYTVELPSAQPYWVEVRDEDDRMIWGPPCGWPPTVTCLELPPLRAQHYSGYCLTWERHPIALPDPGTYFIRGNLPATYPGVIWAEPLTIFVGSVYQIYLPTTINNRE